MSTRFTFGFWLSNGFVCLMLRVCLSLFDTLRAEVWCILFHDASFECHFSLLPASCVVVVSRTYDDDHLRIDMKYKLNAVVCLFDALRTHFKLTPISGCCLVYICLSIFVAEVDSEQTIGSYFWLLFHFGSMLAPRCVLNVVFAVV